MTPVFVPLPGVDPVAIGSRTFKRIVRIDLLTHRQQYVWPSMHDAVAATANIRGSEKCPSRRTKPPFPDLQLDLLSTARASYVTHNYSVAYARW